MSGVLDLSHYKKETTLKDAFLNTYFLSSSFFELENFKYCIPKDCDGDAVCPQQVPQRGSEHCLPTPVFLYYIRYTKSRISTV